MVASTRTFHPYYAPIKRASKVKTELTIDTRQPTVRIKRRNSKTGAESIKVSLPEDEEYEKVVELKEFWRDIFLSSVGVPYEIGSELKQIRLCEKIYEGVGDLKRSKALMKTLLTREELAWVDNKTLDWLAKRANQTRVATILQKKPKKSSRAEYSGERTTETRIVFRSI